MSLASGRSRSFTVPSVPRVPRVPNVPRVPGVSRVPAFSFAIGAKWLNIANMWVTA